jgi:hypothetical protein
MKKVWLGAVLLLVGPVGGLWAHGHEGHHRCDQQRHWRNWDWNRDEDRWQNGWYDLDKDCWHSFDQWPERDQDLD